MSKKSNTQISKNVETTHTCSFLIKLFLESKYSRDNYPKLSSSFCYILTNMFSNMDCNFKYKKSKECNLSQNQIAIMSRTTIKTVNRAIKYFIKIKLINKIKQIGHNNIYKLGKLSTAFAKRSLPPMVDLSYPLGSICPTPQGGFVLPSNSNDINDIKRKENHVGHKSNKHDLNNQNQKQEKSAPSPILSEWMSAKYH